jgi:uncharacterized protein involved in exopolysaccharide biosynthesis
MELINLLRVVRRWLWLIIAVVAMTELALWQGMRSAEPVYVATVTLQISTPQREDVAAYDEYRSISLRDEITVAINNFIELLQSDEVRQRTIGELGLEDKNSSYTIVARQVRDADFVNVTAEARMPSLAAEIANTHVGIAIAYYGELRAKATYAEKDLFTEQLRVAEEELWNAEMALADFRTQNGIYSLEAQMATQRQLLEQLQLERDQRLLEQAAATAVPTPRSSIQVTQIPTVDLVAEVDKLIAQRQKELDQFTALAPRYNILEQNVEQAGAAYAHLLSKYSEAQLKVTAVQAANFIQVIKPAYAPTGAESSWPKLAVLALAGSLGLGVMLAFFLQYLFSSSHARSVTVSVSDQKVPSRGKRSSRKTHSTDAGHEPVAGWVQPAPAGTDFIAASVTVPLSEQKPPLPRKRSSRKTRITDAEQEPVVVQSQHGSTEAEVTLDSDNVAD